MPHATNALVIDRPELQTMQQRVIFGTLTVMFWLLWLVLWLPLLTALSSSIFGYPPYWFTLNQEGYLKFFSVFRAYAMVTLVMAGSLLTWAKYNHLRFRGVDRRKTFALPSLGEIAAVHGRQPAEIAQWREMKIVTVYHDATGRIKHVV